MNSDWFVPLVLWGVMGLIVAEATSNLWNVHTEQFARKSKCVLFERLHFMR